MSSCFVGIDPGKKGAICKISVNVNGEVSLVEVANAPMIGKEYDLQKMARFFHELQNPYCVIEKQQTMPKQGAVSAYTIGRGEALWEMGAAANFIPYAMVRPKEWQKVFGISSTKKNDTKSQSIVIAQRLFPKVDLRVSERARNPSSDKADAILIAEYARRTYLSANPKKFKRTREFGRRK